MSALPTIQIVAALIRRNAEVLLVRQASPYDTAPYWSLPGGVVETGELLTEALAREVREETGLTVLDPGHLICVAHQDNLAQPGWLAFTFKIVAWDGTIKCDDPDRFVLEARFMPLQEAISRLEGLPLRIMREPILAHLTGAVPPGACWFYRRASEGNDALISTLAPQPVLVTGE